MNAIGVEIGGRFDAIVWELVDRVFTAREHGLDETEEAVEEFRRRYVWLWAAYYTGVEHTVAILREGKP